jgi:transposase
MEACCGAHHLGRAFASHGCDVRLMSPEYVRPDVKAQKNDDRNAEDAKAPIAARRKFSGRSKSIISGNAFPIVGAI